MASVNKVFLIGNCGRDPEIRYLPSGQAVANVSLATTSRRKDKNSGEVIEDTQWHRLTFYERLAEIVGEYVKKGSPIHVEGRLKYSKYTDQQGIERYSTDIVVTELQMLGTRQDGGQQGDGGYAPRNQGQGQRQSQGGHAPRQTQGQGQGYGNAPRGQGGGQQGGQRGAPPAQQQRQGGNSGFDDMDDDIPFMDPMKLRGFHLAI